MHVSLMSDGIPLPEPLDPMLIGFRLQEFAISSATLVCGQQRESVD